MRELDMLSKNFVTFSNAVNLEKILLKSEHNKSHSNYELLAERIGFLVEQAKYHGLDAAIPTYVLLNHLKEEIRKQLFPLLMKSNIAGRKAAALAIQSYVNEFWTEYHPHIENDEVAQSQLLLMVSRTP